MTYTLSFIGTQYIIGSELLHVLLSNGSPFARILAQSLTALNVQINSISNKAHPSTRKLHIPAAEYYPITLARQLKITRQHFKNFALFQWKYTAAFQGVLYHRVWSPFLEHLTIHEYVGHEYTITLDLRSLVSDLLENSLLNDSS